MRWAYASFLVVSASMLVACGSDEPQSSAEGTGGAGAGGESGSGGATPVPVTSLASMRQALEGRATGVVAHVVFTDLGDTCEAYAERRAKNADLADYSETVLEFGLNSGSDLEATRYEITHRWGRQAPATGPFATAAIVSTDESCRATRSSSTTGHVRIDGVEASRLTGDFSIQFDDGTLLEGQFDAPDCAAYAKATPDPDAPRETQCLPTNEN